MEEVIRTDGEEFRQFLGVIQDAIALVDRISSSVTPSLCGERYYTGRQVCQLFHISPRALQTYRDTRAIPFTCIGGKILYPESELVKLLVRNMVGVRP